MPEFYTLKDGESLVFDNIYTALGMIKPKDKSLGEGRWIETASAKEREVPKHLQQQRLAAKTKRRLPGSLPPPSQVEQLKQQVDKLLQKQGE